MALATIPGYPRIGKHRELKKALESYWSGKTSASDLSWTAREIRQKNLEDQRSAGLDVVPVNDFSYYDHMLDTIALVGAVPQRFGWSGELVDLDTYLAMARGRDATPAMEMTKWFDTNYHYIVPELGPGTTFRLSSDKPFEALSEAKEDGAPSKVVLVGPITFLLLGKSEDESFDRLSLLSPLLGVYEEVVHRLAADGAEWIQFDEPVLVTGVDASVFAALRSAYARLAAARGTSKMIVQTYFDHVGDAYEALVNLPVDGIGLDFVRGARNLQLLREHGFPKDKTLVAGVIDGRNIWAADLHAAFGILQEVAEHVDSSRLQVSTSCSLQHVPYDVTAETSLDADIQSWLAFATQKLAEVRTLAVGMTEGIEAVRETLDARTALLASAAVSPKRRNPAVQQRLGTLPADADQRGMTFEKRARLQRERLNLPPLPTTTIGSFPQSPDIRKTRRAYEKGDLTPEEYDAFIEQQISDVIGLQEELGIDVLVHGEPERNDMVQYFGEQLDGFAFTRHGWVQSYGSRYVRPPVIYGDVSRPKPMTVRWATYAQSLSEKPVKGMLTGPVTILNWSFVRDDQPRSTTCRQIALAMRDEVADLDAADIAMIQIDEAALREGLPLRREEWDEYLSWATECFRITASGARPHTQIHTHMCYSDFGDIFQAISDMDADVISIENARSGLDLLQTFRSEGYTKGIGPGVYDIHSPRVPPTEEIASNLNATLDVLDPALVWVNPDCGLKTRKMPEVVASLRNMVEATKLVRDSVDAGTSA
jgi:5-methyltetrahydropteroyltriglutamate--homocysteine methyltransferase